MDMEATARELTCSTESLGRWVRSELAGRAATVHTARVIITELMRLRQLPDDELRAATATPADTGDARWNAMIEGIVARTFHLREQHAPGWTDRTRLDEGWAPFGEIVRNNAWYALDVLSTPAELLHRGVILSDHDLQVL